MASKWILTIDELTIFRTGGVDSETASRYRSELAEFIAKVCDELRLDQLIKSTSIVFLYRLFTRRKFHDGDRYLLASACILVACKTEETLRPVRDILWASAVVRHRLESGDSFSVPSLGKGAAGYKDLKDRIIEAERQVLQGISFDLTVEHPYKHIPGLIKAVAKDESKRIAQNAWSMINDSFHTPLSLLYQPYTIACGALHLGSKMEGIPLSDVEVNGEMKPWFDYVGVKIVDLQKISSVMLDLYSKKKKVAHPPCDSPTQFSSPSPGPASSSPAYYNTYRDFDETPRQDSPQPPAWKDSRIATGRLDAFSIRDNLPLPLSPHSSVWKPSSQQGPYHSFSQYQDRYVGIDRKKVDIQHEREMERDGGRYDDRSSGKEGRIAF